MDENNLENNCTDNTHLSRVSSNHLQPTETVIHSKAVRVILYILDIWAVVIGWLLFITLIFIGLELCISSFLDKTFIH